MEEPFFTPEVSLTRDSEKEHTERQLAARLGAWKLATELVDPIVEKHGLELYYSGTIFSPVAKTTPVDQHVDLIMRVADWLLEQ